MKEHTEFINRTIFTQFPANHTKTPKKKVQEDIFARYAPAVREQLRGAASHLAQLRQEQQASDKKVEALSASLRRRGGVSRSCTRSRPATTTSPGWRITSR